MLQAFIVVLREGFESFLLAAITLSYLRKTGRRDLAPAVYAGAAASVGLSAGLGYVLMRGVDEPFWEGVLGIVAIVMVTSLVVHMWRTAPLMKKKMERRLDEISTSSSRRAAFLGVFAFTLVMIAREGMETALALIQVRDTAYVTGIILGLIGTVGVSWMWVRLSHLVNLKRFFQVTGVFLILFMVQVAIYSFHEFCEAGLFVKSTAWHAATEPFSPDGIYGKWFSLAMVLGSVAWLGVAWIADRVRLGLSHFGQRPRVSSSSPY